MRRLVLLLALLGLAGCPAFWAAIPRMAQGAQLVGQLLDIAAAGTDAYYARHPGREAQAEVESALRLARTALAALDAGLLAAEGADDPDLTARRKRALEAYEQLRVLLEGRGVSSATPPGGGAETDAPLPEPFELPTADEIARRMGG